jgi:hypothetical protein
MASRAARRKDPMDDRKFEIHCDASPNGQLHVKSQALSVVISQVISNNKTQESWRSVLVICEESPDGLLTTKIIVCHPEWEQNLQIACIKSRATGPDSASPTVEIDLKTNPV